MTDTTFFRRRDTEGPSTAAAAPPRSFGVPENVRRRYSLDSDLSDGPVEGFFMHGGAVYLDNASGSERTSGPNLPPRRRSASLRASARRASRTFFSLRSRRRHDQHQQKQQKQ